MGTTMFMWIGQVSAKIWQRLGDLKGKKERGKLETKQMNLPKARNG